MKKVLNLSDIFNFSQSDENYKPEYFYNDSDSQVNLKSMEYDELDLDGFFKSLMYIRDQSHLFHWQTFSYAEHEAFQDHYEAYVDKLDNLVENIIAVTGKRPKFEGKSINLKDYSKENIVMFLNECEAILTCDVKIFVAETFTEIYSLIDEILNDLNKLRYRLTLQ